MPEMCEDKVWNFTPTFHSDTYAAIDPRSTPSTAYAGKVVLITGANKGLGRAFAIAYAEAGASVIIIGSRSGAADVTAAALDAAQKAGRSRPSIHEVKIDVCDPASIDKAAAAVKEKAGRLDILINNAGYLNEPLPLLDLDALEYLHTMDVNFNGAYRVTRALLPLMLEGGDRTVVLLTSVGASVVMNGMGPYSISKLALCRFAQYLADEYGANSLAYHPGGIVTDLSNKAPASVRHLFNDTPELASHTLTFLTQERREWLAGRHVLANWDMPELVAKADEITEKNLLKFRCIVD